MSDQEKADFENFEGNAMGFRLLTKTLPSQSEIEGGLNLTYATLGAFTKYPRESGKVETGSPCYKKFGFFQSEKELFEELASQTGLKEKDAGGGVKAWQRHPLAYLVEAADDICYSIMDLEDGFKLGLLSYKKLSSLLCRLIKKAPTEKLSKLKDNREKASYLRAIAVNNLVEESAGVFSKNIESILDGSFEKDILSAIPQSEAVKEIKKFSFKHVYSYHKAVEIEAAGFEVLGGLLNLFLSAIYSSDAKSKKIKSLIPGQFHSNNNVPKYEKVMRIVQFVSGMTDTYAIDMYRKLKGISLPNY
jgi:dGTPase